MKNPWTNKGRIFFGVSDVASSMWWSLERGEKIKVRFGSGNITLDTIYVDAVTSGDDAQWSIVVD